MCSESESLLSSSMLAYYYGLTKQQESTSPHKYNVQQCTKTSFSEEERNTSNQSHTLYYTYETHLIAHNYLRPHRSITTPAMQLKPHFKLVIQVTVETLMSIAKKLYLYDSPDVTVTHLFNPKKSLSWICSNFMHLNHGPNRDGKPRHAGSERQ